MTKDKSDTLLGRNRTLSWKNEKILGDIHIDNKLYIVLFFLQGEGEISTMAGKLSPFWPITAIHLVQTSLGTVPHQENQ